MLLEMMAFLVSNLLKERMLLHTYISLVIMSFIGIAVLLLDASLKNDNAGNCCPCRSKDSMFN